MEYKKFPYLYQYFTVKDLPYLYYVSEIKKDFIVAKKVGSSDKISIYSNSFECVQIDLDFHEGDFIKIINKDIVKFQRCEYGCIIKANDNFVTSEDCYTIKLENGEIINMFVDENKPSIIKINGKTINKEEENKMDCEKLLKMWIKLNTENYNEKQEKEIEKILNRDMVAIELSDRLDQVNEILNEFIEKYPELCIRFNLTGSKPEDVITDDSREEIKKIEKKYDDLKDELIDIGNEVTMATSICESEESLRKVLKAYGIIDTNGKIKIK